jgi:hypothetical protein
VVVIGRERMCKVGVFGWGLDWIETLALSLWGKGQRIKRHIQRRRM